MVSTVLRMAGSRPCYRRAYNKEGRERKWRENGRGRRENTVEGEKTAGEGGKQQGREKNDY